MKKIFFIALAITVCFTSCRHKTLEDRAEKEAAEYSQKLCPTPFANDVSTDSLGFNRETKTFSYYCRVRGELDDAKLLSENLEKFREAMRKNIANDTGTKVYKDAKYQFEYVLRSTKHPDMVLMKVTFNAEDYNRK